MRNRDSHVTVPNSCLTLGCPPVLPLVRFIWSLGGLLLGFCLLSAKSACAAGIATVEDQHGHRIYINAGDHGKAAAGLRPYSFRVTHETTSTGSTGSTGQPGSKTKPDSKGQTGSNSPPEATPEVARLVQETADRFRIDPDLVHAIIRVESAYNSKAVSRKGAKGLMQLIPTTARRFGVEDIFDPKQNIQGGVNYLRYLLDMFGGNLPLSLAAYNAGENSVLRYGGIPSFRETRDYVRKVTSLYGFDSATGARRNPADPWTPPVRRYVDLEGVVHFSNVD